VGAKTMALDNDTQTIYLPTAALDQRLGTRGF